MHEDGVDDFGRGEGGHMSLSGEDFALTFGGEAGHFARHLGGGMGVVFAGGKEGGDGEAMQFGGEDGVAFGEELVCAGVSFGVGGMEPLSDFVGEGGCFVVLVVAEPSAEGVFGALGFVSCCEGFGAGERGGFGFGRAAEHAV